MQFYWVTPPSDLGKNIEAWAKRVVTAVFAMLTQVGSRMQNDARQKAAWEDRTGNARSGLFFAVDGSAMGMQVVVGQMGEISGQDTGILAPERESFTLILSHTMWYGKFLELSNGGKYAVIMTTMERNLPGLESMMRRVLS